MSGAYDWIGNLQEIMWGGLTASCLETSFDGGHDQAERKYPYVDGAAHDNTGRTPYSIRATLVFNNTIASDLLPARLEKWLDALENGKIDGLSHPVLGNMFARVAAPERPRDPTSGWEAIFAGAVSALPEPHRHGVHRLFQCRKR